MNILIHGNIIKTRKGRRPPPFIPDPSIQWWASSINVKDPIPKGGYWNNGVTPSQTGWGSRLSVGSAYTPNTVIIPNTGIYIPSNGSTVGNSYIGGAGLGTVVPPGTSPLTAMLWMKGTQPNTHYNNSPTGLFHLYNRNLYRGWAILLNNRTGKIEIWIAGLYSRSAYFVCADDLNSDQQWHHVALTRSGATVKVYIDGVLKETRSTSGGTANISSVAHLGICSNIYLLTNIICFKGYMDDMRYYTRALSLEEIVKIYEWKRGN